MKTKGKKPAAPKPQEFLLEEQSMAIKKPHCIEVTCASISEVDGVQYINQELILREYANDATELVEKNLAIVESGFPAILEACKNLAKGQGVL